MSILFSTIWIRLPIQFSFDYVKSFSKIWHVGFKGLWIYLNEHCWTLNQMSFIFFSQSEDIRLDPELYDPCKSDISRLCPNVNFGNAQVRNIRNIRASGRHQDIEASKTLPYSVFSPLPTPSFLSFPAVLIFCSLSAPLYLFLRFLWNLLSSSPQMIECLKEQKKQLSQRCHQRIFRLQEVEMTDPELDYQLMRVCKQMIKVRRARNDNQRVNNKALYLYYSVFEFVVF